MSSCSNRKSDRGLTLIELMVATVVAVILMGSIYYVYTVSTGAYRIQAQTMRAMDQARFGLEQLKRDIAAAGFLATPNSLADNSVCPKPTAPNPHIRGFVIRKEGDTNGNPVFPDGFLIFGSFWGSNVFYTQSVLGNTVTLQAGTEGFPRTQVDWDQTFRPGRFLRIVNSEQFEGYYPINAANFGARTITLAWPVTRVTPPETCGVAGMGVGLEVNVAGYLHYVLRADPAVPGKVDLIREEMDGTSATLANPLPNTAVRIAEFVADLQLYDFTVDVDPNGRQPTLQTLRFDDNVLVGPQLLTNTDLAQPQDLRAVTVKLTTRTEEEDERWVFPEPIFDRAAHTPIDYYEVDPNMRGMARTVTMAGRVGLKAFAVRNVK